MGSCYWTIQLSSIQFLFVGILKKSKQGLLHISDIYKKSASNHMGNPTAGRVSFEGLSQLIRFPS